MVSTRLPVLSADYKGPGADENQNTANLLPLRRGAKILILDPEWAQTDYLVAALHANGFDVVVGTSDQIDHRGIGRYCRGVLLPAVDDPDYSHAVERLLASDRVDLVIPTSEDIMRRLWQLDSFLTSKQFPGATQEQKGLVLDRRISIEMASRQGVAIPAQMAVGGPADLPKAAARFGFPLVLRGLQGTGGLQVRIVREMTELEPAYEQIRGVSPEGQFVQEFITGIRCTVGALLDRGRIVQAFATQALETWPLEESPSIRVRSHYSEHMLRRAQDFFAATRWSGLASIQFIEKSNGELYFVEFNPRPWGGIRAAKYCGLDFHRLFADYLLGIMPAKSIPFANGVDCVLFPQYILTRIRTGRFWRLREVTSYLRALSIAPWNRPALLFHILRRVRWALHK